MTTFTFQETPESRSQQYDSSATNNLVTHIYKAVGEQDDNVVATYVANNAAATVPTFAGVLYLKTVRIRPDGFQQYYVEIDYGPLSITSIPKGSYTFNFDTTGGTTNVKCGKTHVGSYYPAGATETPANPHMGVIGVKDDGGVDGADIVIPKFKFSVAFKYPSGVITVARAKLLASITGCTNSDKFLEFQPGELLFLGASGADGSQSEMEVTFNFEASANETGLTVAGVTGVSKKGHEYGWEEFGDKVASGLAVVNAKAVHIEQVYNSANFAKTFQWNIFTG